MKKKLLALILALAMVLSLASVAGAATHIVQEGDNLSKLAEQYLGSRLKWREIYEANKDKISDPNSIYVGQELTIPGTETSEEPQIPVVETPKVDKSTQPRVLITTDLECDDMNGILLSLLFANDYDLAGIVWTAGMFHFSGDGEHTLGDIIAKEDIKCEEPNPEVLTECRPVDPTWLTRAIDVFYRADYEYLSKNDPNYPTPDYVLSIAKTGNIEFESDVRYETEGSQFIEELLLDDDPRELYIMHWGGSNTTVRALLSIYEDYYGTEEWDAVLAKLVSKVRLIGHGEDNCWTINDIAGKFPGLVDSSWSSPLGFTNYFGAIVKGSVEGLIAFAGSDEEVVEYYQAAWTTEAYKFNHGQMMSKFLLMNDGQVIYGEPDDKQYGLLTYVDWNLPGLFPRVDHNTYDWVCCQWGTSKFVDLGLRQGTGSSGNQYVIDLFEEWAARADWAVMDPEDCNHAPVVGAAVLDYTAKAGETVSLIGTAGDPDGDKLSITWWVPSGSWTYAAAVEGTELTANGNGTTATFTVPADAVAGDRFVVNMEVQDIDVERPMTRYVQFVITVK